MGWNLLRGKAGRWVLVLTIGWVVAVSVLACMPRDAPISPVANMYLCAVEFMYGMSDEARHAANQIGEEINVLRAQNRDLGMAGTAEVAAQIDTNDKRILGLLGELDRLPGEGWHILPGFSAVDCLNLPEYLDFLQAESAPAGLSSLAYTHTEDELAEDNHAHVLGNRQIWVNGSICTSGVVVKRTTAGGVAETGVLTNKHCGDAGEPVTFDWEGDSAEMGEGRFHGCDCAFVKLEHEYVSPDTIWTDWGPLTISEYRNFEVGEWVEFHGRDGYSLGRVLDVRDFLVTKVYVIDVKTTHGDSGGPFIALRDGSFGGMNSGVVRPDGASYGFSWQTVQQELGVERP